MRRDEPRVRPAHPPHPGLPGGRRLRARRRRGHAGLQRDAVPAAARRCSTRREPPSRASTAIPTRRSSKLRAELSRRHGVPRTASRSATAPATSCSPPPRPCSSRAPRSSTPGRRSRCTRTWRRPPAPRAVTVGLDDDDRHDLDAMAAAVTVATRLLDRLQPEQPDRDRACPLADIAALLRDVPPYVLRDRRRGLLRVQRARRPRRHASTCSSTIRTSCCCGRSPRSTGCAGCASATRCAARRPSAPRSTRCASPSSPTRRRRPRRWRRSATRTRWRAGSSRRIAARLGLEEGLRDLGLAPSESQTNFVWFALPEEADEAAVVAALGERKVLVRAGDALGRERRLRVTCGTPAENDASCPRCGMPCRPGARLLQSPNRPCSTTAAALSSPPPRRSAGSTPTPTPGDLARRSVGFGEAVRITGLHRPSAVPAGP